MFGTWRLRFALGDADELSGRSMGRNSFGWMAWARCFLQLSPWQIAMPDNKCEYVCILMAAKSDHSKLWPSLRNYCEHIVDLDDQTPDSAPSKVGKAYLLASAGDFCIIPSSALPPSVKTCSESPLRGPPDGLRVSGNIGPRCKTLS